jgi:hypothetical protein
MDLLRRYHKPGGFLQLLQLIETCAPQKQQQLLGSVEKESRVWAEEVRNKMLTIDRIFGWAEQPLAEVISRVQELTLAVAAHGIEPQLWAKATKTLSHGQRRRIDDLSKSKNPTPGELLSANTKIIAEVRDMINQGYVHLPTVDPALIIEEDIEDRLGKRAPGVTHHVVTSSGLPPVTMPVSKPAAKSFSGSATDRVGASHGAGTTHRASAQGAAATQGAAANGRAGTSPSSISSQEVQLELAKLRLENQSLRLQLQNLQTEIHNLQTVLSQIKKTVA